MYTLVTIALQQPVLQFTERFVLLKIEPIHRPALQDSSRPSQYQLFNQQPQRQSQYFCCTNWLYVHPGGHREGSKF